MNSCRRLGVLGPNLLAVHSVWLQDDEVALFADRSALYSNSVMSLLITVYTEVPVSHCPAAAMRYLGFARVPEMLEKGVTVTIGTDGAPSNNRYDRTRHLRILTFPI